MLSFTPAPPPLHVVAAVIADAAGRILLARRGPGGVHGGLWEFPGGKVEAGETPARALARELTEELGVEVAVGESFLTVDHAYPHVHILLDAYRCRIEAGRPQALDCAEVRWVETPDLHRYPMPEADLPIARLLERRGRNPPGCSPC